MSTAVLEARFRGCSQALLYNEDRLHSSLGNLTPAEYATKLAAGEIPPRKRQHVRTATGRSAAICVVSADRPVASAEAAVHSP
jgi:hypothetical protein